MLVMSEATGHDFGHLPRPAAGLGQVFARPKVLAVLCVIVLATLGWLYTALLFAKLDGSLASSSATFVPALCRPFADFTLSAREVIIIVSMWGAMTLAMMLPSAAPMIMTYAGIADTAARKNESIVSPFVLAAGYAVVWFAFAFIAALIQVVLTLTNLIDTTLDPANNAFVGIIFIGAGLYQYSWLKHSCLTRCQQPFSFFLTNWTTTSTGVFRLGIRQGVYCLGCCWAMMLVMLAVGVMNVVWMAGLGIIMTVEKLLSGRRFTHAIGMVLIALGVCSVFLAFAGEWPRW